MPVDLKSLDFTHGRSPQTMQACCEMHTGSCRLVARSSQNACQGSIMLKWFIQARMRICKRAGCSSNMPAAASTPHSRLPSDQWLPHVAQAAPKQERLPFLSSVLLEFVIGRHPLWSSCSPHGCTASASKRWQQQHHQQQLQKDCFQVIIFQALPGSSPSGAAADGVAASRWLFFRLCCQYVYCSVFNMNAA